MSLLDEVAKRDNTKYLASSDCETCEHIFFSKYSGYILFNGIVTDSKLLNEIDNAIRNAEKIAYKAALDEISLKIDAHKQTILMLSQ